MIILESLKAGSNLFTRVEMLSGWQIPYMINDILSICILLLISKLNASTVPCHPCYTCSTSSCKGAGSSSSIRSQLFLLDGNHFIVSKKSSHPISICNCLLIYLVHSYFGCLFPSLTFIYSKFLHTSPKWKKKKNLSTIIRKNSGIVFWFSSLCLECLWACSFW